MKTFILLLLTTLPVTTNAQTPPMPPNFGDYIILTNRIHYETNWLERKTNFIINLKRQPTYTALCPHCRVKFSNLHPLTIVTNGVVTTNGGGFVQRTMTFACPNRDCLETFTSRNTVFVPESIAVEDLPNGASAADTPKREMFVTVGSDTIPPVISSFQVYQASITNFTNHVLFSSSLVSSGSWTDPESGTIVRRIFDVSWPVHSNEFFTAWCTGNLNTPWHEFPTPSQLHPARSNFTYATYFPIQSNGTRFYTVRSKSGNGVTYQ